MSDWYKLQRTEPGMSTRMVGYLYMDPMSRFQIEQVLLHPPPSFFSNKATVQPYPESGAIEEAADGWGWARISQPFLGTSAWMLGSRDEQRRMKHWLERVPMPPQTYKIVAWH